MTMNEQEEADLVQTIVRLLQENVDVRAAIVRVVMASPNVITEI